MRLDIKLLGPLEATLNNVSVVPSAAKIRNLLAILALNAGHLVSVPTLVGEIWGQRPPRTALTTLHTYVGKLRKNLRAATPPGMEQHAKRVLVTEPMGYRLNAPFVLLDIDRYEELAGPGRRAAEDGDYRTASRRLLAAADLWRGPLLADLVAGPQMTIESVRLEQVRLSDLDLRIEADLRLGRDRTLLAELAGLVARYPLSENFAAKYMLALYRSGQQWRALEVFGQLRHTMVEELGVDPAAGIRGLHEAVLRGDPVTDLGSPPANWLTARAIAG